LYIIIIIIFILFFLFFLVDALASSTSMPIRTTTILLAC